MKKLIISLLVICSVWMPAQKSHGLLLLTAVDSVISPRHPRHDSDVYLMGMCWFAVMTIIGIPFCILGNEKDTNLNLEDLAEQGYTDAEINTISNDLKFIEANLKNNKVSARLGQQSAAVELKAIHPQMSDVTIRFVDDVMARMR